MFGLGLDIYQELKQAPDVSDLLIAMFASGAMNTSRISLCFPNEVVSMDGSMGLRLPDGSNDTGLLLEVLSKLPSIEDMVTAANGSEAGLIAYLNSLHPLLFPLLRWLFATSRGYLRKLEKEEVRTSVCTYVLLLFFWDMYETNLKPFFLVNIAVCQGSSRHAAICAALWTNRKHGQFPELEIKSQRKVVVGMAWQQMGKLSQHSTDWYVRVVPCCLSLSSCIVLMT